MIRILLVDDQPLIRSGLAALIDAEDDLSVVAQAADGAEALELAERHRPELVLMDVRMPNVDGIEATRRIAARTDLSSTRVLILTNYGQDEFVFRALRAGAAGFLVKDADPTELLQAVRVVAEGDALLSPAVTKTLISEFVARPEGAVRAGTIQRLTPREREVVTLVGHGLSNSEIAEILVVSETTAKTHVSRAMTKVQARDRAQLVVLAYEAGLVTPRTDDNTDRP